MKNMLSIKKTKVLLTSFKNGATINAAIKAASIPMSSYFYYMKKYPKLKARIDEIKDSRVFFVEDAQYVSAIQGNVTAQKLYLLNHSKNKSYKTGDETNVLVQNSVNVNVKGMSDDELNEIIRRNINGNSEETEGIGGRGNLRESIASLS